MKNLDKLTIKELKDFIDELDKETHWTHSILESMVEYLGKGKDLDNNGMIDEYDYELYLSDKVEHLEHR